jgi:hypothetical protein
MGLKYCKLFWIALIGDLNSCEIDVNIICVVCLVVSSRSSYFDEDMLWKKKITRWLSLPIRTGWILRSKC